jgi:hypothetical protein
MKRLQCISRQPYSHCSRAPASDAKQLSQVNVQALMQNVHELTDTTPAVPY